MYECNECAKSCNPSKDALKSNAHCTAYVRIRRTFKFPECVSRVVITNPKNPAIAKLLEYAK